MTSKIMNLESLAQLVAEYRERGRTVAQCHGCFDLVHPGHVRHFQEARRQADVLVVTVTPDRFVNKGPGRPLFPEQLRLEHVAALEDVDHVALTKAPTAIEALRLIRPDLYVKGPDYRDPERDVTGNIRLEIEAVESGGGHVHYTEGVVFSSTELINTSFRLLSHDAQQSVDQLRLRTSATALEEFIDRMKTLNVVVIGDVIIDEYCYCRPMGRVEKAPIVSVRYLHEERYPGGVLAVANHLAQFAGGVHLVTLTNHSSSTEEFIREHVDGRVSHSLVSHDQHETTTKRRFLTEGGNQKIFEIGWIPIEVLPNSVEQQIIETVAHAADRADLVIVADFGHGMITDKIIEYLVSQDVPLAVNAQTNSTNFGYNYITRYPRADFISIDENELRLPFQNRHADVETLAQGLVKRTRCDSVNVTLGRDGSMLYHKGLVHRCPALATRVVDTVGAGDAVFALLSLAWRMGLEPELVPFFGNAVGALAVEIMGNKTPVKKGDLVKCIRGLLE